jgi:ATP-dependent DNA ligase
LKETPPQTKMTSVASISDLRKAPGTWVAPYLYQLPEVVDGKHTWKVFVELRTADDLPLVFNDAFYAGKEIPHAKAYTYTVYGQNKKVTSAKTPVVGKNIGKVNQTNVWTQALMNALSAYNKHIKLKQAKTAPINELTLNEDANTQDGENNKFPPMLIDVYARVDLKGKTLQWKKREKPFNFDDAYIQAKFDGERCISYVSGDLNGRPVVSLYSRKLIDIPKFIHLKLQLSKVYEAAPFNLRDGTHIEPTRVYFDGELYHHGIPLQKINSIVRNQTTSAEEDKQLEFHIFDCFIPALPALTFTQRQEIIARLIRTEKLIVRVETVRISSEDDAGEYTKRMLQQGFEGAVIKRGDGTYKFGYNNNRSRECLKIKRRLDSEYQVVEYTSGVKGKEIGALIWVLQTEDGQKFNVVPKVEGKLEDKLKLRYALYTALRDDPRKFDREYKGKFMRVEYEDLSDKGIPLRAKAIGIREDA